VSRFPSELRDMCIEHWERGHSAGVGVGVVCNGKGGDRIISLLFQENIKVCLR
jgi:hypothetical protein